MSHEALIPSLSGDLFTFLISIVRIACYQRVSLSEVYSAIS